MASPESALQNYVVKEEIGRGSFSIVKRVVHKTTSKVFAMKSIPKRLVSRQGWVNLSREIEIMLHLNHPHILKLHEFINTQTHIHLIIEYMSGGELFDHIISRGKFSEQDASKIVKQMLLGIGYLHDMGVAHRDLKPENLLCESKDNENRVVVADFGLAKIFGRGELLRTHCGTPHYAAPEIVRGDQSYDKAVDMWSVGVITYVLLSGFFPFFHDDQEILKRRIAVGEFKFPEEQWSHISDTAKDFVSKLLMVDPTLRYTAQQALQHPWIEGTTSVPNTICLRSSMENFQTNKRRLRESGGDGIPV